MREELVFLTNSVNASNLNRLAERVSAEEELRMLELSDIAEDAAALSAELFSSGFSLYEVMSVLGDGVPFSEQRMHKEVMPENKRRLSDYLAGTDRLLRAVFCELYTEKLSLHGTELSERDFLASSAPDNSFTYVRNAFSDEAYDVFSSELEDARVRYSKNFKECADSVASGAVSYALFPLEERGGRLPTVSELIFRYDFKINAVTPVFGMDNTAELKYAMVSKHFTVPECTSDDDKYLEVRLGHKSDMSISDLISVSELLGSQVYRINTSTVSTESGEQTVFTAVLRDGGRGFSPLLVYLTLFGADYTAVGMYKNLE